MYGLWVDEQAYTFEIEAAYTLDAGLEQLDTLEVTSYVVEQVP